ncbi:MAG: response regulator [Bdellovibrionales bacterium]|nr:response regulator [Bdellovibrionales bacterium]
MELRMAGKKILVADDSLTIQKVIRLALSGDGYEIQTVSDGKEAIEQASLFRPDICIIDVSLPKYDAYQIREKFIHQADLKNIPVIMMSSAFEKVDETRMQELGFCGHLVKPFDPSHLRSTLLSVAEQAAKIDPVMDTINSPMESSSGPEVMSLDDIGPVTLTPPKRVAAFADFPPLANDFQGGLDDIQELAKNTFEMSGLNQHDWGMIEPGRGLEPSVEEMPMTSPPLREKHHSHKHSEVSGFDLAPPPPPVASEPRFSLEEVEAMVKSEVARVLEEMHFQIQDRINHDMKQFTEEFIPNLAEKIIKDEIHRLLSNPPV